MYVPKRKNEVVIARLDGDYVRAQFTGKSGKWDEHFEIETIISEETAYLHYEDILEFTDKNINKYLN